MSTRRFSHKAALTALLCLIFVALPLGAAAQTKTKIVHWQHSSPARDEMMKRLAQEFMAANPDVEVEVQVYPLAEYLNKVLVALAGGAGPDTMQVRSNWVPWLIPSGMVQPLAESLITTEEIDTEFIPGPLEPLKGADGRYYGLPTDVQTVVLFYQPQLFEAVGLDGNRPPTTWQEAVEAGRRIARFGPDGQTERMGLATGGYEPVLISLMLQNGAVLWDEAEKLPRLDSKEATDALQWAADLVTVHRVEDPGFGSRWTAFRNETLGMVYAHPAMMGSFRSTHPDLEFGIVEIPAPEPGGSQTSLVTSWSLTVTSQASDPELATEWLLFVQSKESQERWFLETGELPTRFEVIQQPSLREDPLHEPIMWSLVRAVSQPWISDDVNPTIRAAWNRLRQGEAPPEVFATMQLEAVNAEKATRAERGLD
jgi:multiple sugar transport system substrate-binding protein